MKKGEERGYFNREWTRIHANGKTMNYSVVLKLWEGLYAPTFGARSPSGHKAPPTVRTAVISASLSLSVPARGSRSVRITCRFASSRGAVFHPEAFSADCADERGS